MNDYPVLVELRRLERAVEAGKDYGFEQSVWREARIAIERLKDELAAMTNSRDAYSNALMKEARRSALRRSGES